MILDELDYTSQSKKPSLPRLIDSLSIPPSYQGLLERLIGNWVICRTEKEAISFQKQTSYWNCLTVDGVEYYNKGEVRKNWNMNWKYGYYSESEKYPLYKYYKEDEIERAKDLLINTNMTMKDIAKELNLGYSTVKKLNYGTLRHDNNVEYPLRVVNAPLQRANRIK